MKKNIHLIYSTPPCKHRQKAIKKYSYTKAEYKFYKDKQSYLFVKDKFCKIRFKIYKIRIKVCKIGEILTYADINS